VTPHSLAEIYGKAGQIGTTAIKAEQEMAGDDPESRKASALDSLSEDELDARLKEALAIIGEAESG